MLSIYILTKVQRKSNNVKHAARGFIFVFIAAVSGNVDLELHEPELNLNLTM